MSWMDHPEQDDRGPLTAEEERGMDPFCDWCGDETERWVMRDGLAVREPCPKCSGAEK